MNCPLHKPAPKFARSFRLDQVPRPLPMVASSALFADRGGGGLWSTAANFTHEHRSTHSFPQMPYGKIGSDPERPPQIATWSVVDLLCSTLLSSNWATQPGASHQGRNLGYGLTLIDFPPIPSQCIHNRSLTLCLPPLSHTSAGVPSFGSGPGWVINSLFHPRGPRNGSERTSTLLVQQPCETLSRSEASTNLCHPFEESKPAESLREALQF